MTFKGKVALITGAASGIGRATAIAFADAGAAVALLDRDETGLGAVERSIQNLGGEALAFACDLTDPGTAKAAVDAVEKRWSRLDCAVNAAGVEGRTCELLEEDDALYDHTMDINLRAMWHCMRAQIPPMLANPNGGSIVNISSGAGLVGSKRSAVYSMSKHAVIGLTRSAALQYAKRGVRINAVCPAGVQTPMAERIIATYDGSAPSGGGAFYPLGRSSTAEEIASGILWLSSPGAASAVGTALTIDAGFTAA
ncbi:SDR family oxidoreductase [Sphingopyxis sp. JAI128]|uniref:SDR family oxidoreductase n=1 Tax=Sphingopyxis sp. JAI128 TaxID=2723066 RepID=UPI00161F2616|nr:SDR family oxidoreductase [Sphingopyxis sp. JAI128]MBB6425786.1 NAD(P)-dependent dehydrogenase (short-subunit alcohol dehydrogenase family) [Sphingopyxis sp. JAI128]